MTSCPYCHEQHDVRDLCRARPSAGLSRRRFLFLGASAAAAVVAAPLMPLAPAGCALDMTALESASAAVVIRQRYLYARVLITPEMIANSKYAPVGAFMEAYRAENAWIDDPRNW